MSKEWVEDKKKQLENATVFINENGNEAVEISLTVLNKLFEQAKRVDELERKNYDLREDLAGRHSTVEELNEKIDELYSQNNRYRTSVEKIKRKIASNDERISQLSTEPQFHDPSGRINTLNGQAHGLETALEILEDDSDE